MSSMLPAEGKGGLLAGGLLLIVLILGYLLFFAGFVDRQRVQAEEVQLLREREQALRANAAQLPQLRADLDAIRQRDAGSTLYLSDENFDLAAASLTTRVREVVATRARNPQRCQIQSTQNVRATEPEDFEKVSVQIRMRCDLEDFVAIAYELESGVPMLFLENVQLYMENIAYLQNLPAIGFLDVRFDVTGYLRMASTVKSANK